MSEEWPCSQCSAVLASRGRLEGHLVQVHGRTPREALVRRAIIGVALAAIVVVAGIAIARRGGDGAGASVTREDNLQRFGISDDPHLGNATAPIVIVEFGTPRCTACRYFHTNLLPELITNYIDPGDVVLYYQQFTIGYAFDEPGGVAQECVNKHLGNDAFWAFTELLYQQQGRYDAGNVDELLETFATERGEDPGATVTCYRTFETQDEYDEDLRAGERAGVSGTPSFYVFGPTGRALATSMNDLAATIEELLGQVDRQ